MDFLKGELNDVGFFYPQKKSKSMFNNITDNVFEIFFKQNGNSNPLGNDQKA